METMQIFLQFVDKIKSMKPVVPYYNFLDVINKNDDENIISSWLAFCLTPEKCGSTAPLNRFAAHFGIDFDGEPVEVKREYYLENKRRIDIVIKGKSAWIIIENKIKSFENNEQTVDYFCQINQETKAEKVEYIFLKPDYNNAKPASPHFQRLTYGELLKLWNPISKTDFIHDDYYFYFDNLMKLIEGNYAVKNEITFENEITLYANNKKALFVFEKAYEQACLDVKKKLMSALREVFVEDEGWVIRPLTDYIQIYLKKWAAGVHYELGTWKEQRFDRGTSFDSLIDAAVWIGFYIHAEGDIDDGINAYAATAGRDGEICQDTFDFSTGTACITSIKKIVEIMKYIDEKYSQKLVELCGNG